MAEFAESLKEELTCPVCVDYFSHPVTLGCGHSFCHPCLLRNWEESSQPGSCPLCRRAFQITDLEVNSRLGRLVLIAKNMRPYLLKPQKDPVTCERHQVEHKLFCEEDQTLLCAACFQPQAHSGHTVHPTEKAAKESRDKLQKHLDLLQKEVEIVQTYLADERREMEILPKEVHAWKQSIGMQYKRLNEFLKREEKWHLRRLDREESKNMKTLRESEARLSRHLQSLREVMVDLEQHGQKPDLQFLQKVGKALKRSEGLLSQRPKVTHLQEPIFQITGIWDMVKHFKVNVTLDPESACPCLLVSEDRKTVSHGSCQENIAVAPHQFGDSFILGAQVFTFGIHYWEVDVGGREWSVGVCKTSMSGNPVSSEDAFLLTQLQREGGYSVEITPLFTECQLNSPIQKVGIFLDYDQGHISFYDAKRASLIFHFPLLDFSEPLKPLFCPSLPMGEEMGIPMTINPGILILEELSVLDPF